MLTRAEQVHAAVALRAPLMFSDMRHKCHLADYSRPLSAGYSTMIIPDNHDVGENLEPSA